MPDDIAGKHTSHNDMYPYPWRVTASRRFELYAWSECKRCHTQQYAVAQSEFVCLCHWWWFLINSYIVAISSEAISNLDFSIKISWLVMIYCWTTISFSVSSAKIAFFPELIFSDYQFLSEPRPKSGKRAPRPFACGGTGKKRWASFSAGGVCICPK